MAGGVRIPATAVRLRARPILDSRLGEAARPPAMEGADADVALTENAADVGDALGRAIEALHAVPTARQQRTGQTAR